MMDEVLAAEIKVKQVRPVLAAFLGWRRRGIIRVALSETILQQMLGGDSSHENIMRIIAFGIRKSKERPKWIPSKIWTYAAIQVASITIQWKLSQQ